MRLIAEMGPEDYWPEFKDSASNRIISVSQANNDSGIARQFTVEPTSINFQVDSAKGLPPSAVLSNEHVSTLFKGIQSFCEAFKITDLARAGLRTLVLATVGDSKDAVKRAAGTLNAEMVAAVENVLGAITDVGVAFDGEGSDKLQFHMRVGPYSSQEAPKYFEQSVADAMTSQANFIADLDFFEINFSMTVRAMQWSRAPVEKVEKLLSKVGPVFLGKAV